MDSSSVVLVLDCSRFPRHVSSTKLIVIEPRCLGRLISANGSVTMAPPAPEEEALRICLSCQHYLQKRCDFIAFERIEKHPLVQYYEVSRSSVHPLEVRLRKLCMLDESSTTSMRPIRRSSILSCILFDCHSSPADAPSLPRAGDTIYELKDAQDVYNQIRSCYQTIDSVSSVISKLSAADQSPADEVRLTTIGRNIRMYAREYVQNCVLKTRRLPDEKQIEAARQQRQLESGAGWRPTVDRHLLETADEFEPFAQQHYQVVEFIRQAELAGRHDEVEVLQRNLRELEQVMLESRQTKLNV